MTAPAAGRVGADQRRLGVDVGGTFTDLVGLAPDGTAVVKKISSTPADLAVAVWALVDAVGGGATLVHGTTIATNALLERRRARVVLVTTEGFEDLLWLRRQDRADLYDLGRDHPPPLIEREDVIGACERIGASGVVTPLDDTEVARVVDAVAARGPEAVAVGLLFAFRHPGHEARLATGIRKRLPGIPVVASAEVAPLFREYERISTVTAEAYLRPRVSAYVARLAHGARRRSIGTVRVMASSGGSLAPGVAADRAAALALSGPAGGVVGAQAVARAVGVRDVLTLDMGGTSADASLLMGGEALHETQRAVAGVPLLLPSIVIETVSAGGGSLGWVDAGGALKVGPRSAGAAPGPACYSRGGTEPTVTDALLALGWLDPLHPLAAEVTLDPAAAICALEPLARRIGKDVPGAAWGMVEVAAATMARALKQVSVRRGIDPRGLALLPFGGAGPLFGCLLAEQLGLSTVIVPPHPGVLSALGLAVAPERVDGVASVHRDVTSLSDRDVASVLGDIARPLVAELPGAELQHFADCRFAGQGYEVLVPVAAGVERLARDFVVGHRARYGHGDLGRQVEVVALRVVATRPAPAVRLAADPAVGSGATRRTRIGWRGGTAGGSRLPLEGLQPGTVVDGPALFDGEDATAFVAPGWRAVCHASGALVVTRL